MLSELEEADASLDHDVRSNLWRLPWFALLPPEVRHPFSQCRRVPDPRRIYLPSKGTVDTTGSRVATFSTRPVGRRSPPYPAYGRWLARRRAPRHGRYAGPEAQSGRACDVRANLRAYSHHGDDSRSTRPWLGPDYRALPPCSTRGGPRFCAGPSLPDTPAHVGRRLRLTGPLTSRRPWSQDSANNPTTGEPVSPDRSGVLHDKDSNCALRVLKPGARVGRSWRSTRRGYGSGPVAVEPARLGRCSRSLIGDQLRSTERHPQLTASCGCSPLHRRPRAAERKQKAPGFL